MNKPLTTMKYNKGMTLVELLVVLAIFLIVAGLTIFDYGRFRSSISLQNLADDISLSIRRAQNYAIGVHSSQSSIFYSGYGIHFSTNAPSGIPLSGSNKSFVIFADVDGDKIYDYNSGSASSACNGTTLGAGNECVDLLSITSSDQILSICNGASCTTGYVDIVFNRPNPDAFIVINGSTSVDSVDIKVQNNQSLDTKTISISKVGQISVR
jgi:prepilin-type N-terminal cleavage/methylation domain-containing protein